jgi:hypothetical protein
VRRRLLEAGLPVLPSESHIVPVVVGNPQRCKAISDELLLRFGIYVQPINYPTVPRGTERLRLTPTPLHSDEQIGRLVTALAEIWNRSPVNSCPAGRSPIPRERDGIDVGERPRLFDVGVRRNARQRKRPNWSF